MKLKIEIEIPEPDEKSGMDTSDFDNLIDLLKQIRDLDALAEVTLKGKLLI